MTVRDESFMRLALAMARRGLGRTWPNPSVGAVLVSGDGETVLSRGWTMPGGAPHAETVALERAGDLASGATLYITLEPCAHHGRTPPCAEAIVAAGVSRVVCGTGDANPQVAGKGFEILRAAGLEVVTGVLEDEARGMVHGHLLRVSEGRPEVTLKLATGADGLVAPGDGAPVWVTGEQARARAHLLRARADAILAGRGTIEADDPELTCRLPGMADRSPVRVILDSALATTRTAKILQDTSIAPVWILCAGNAPARRREALIVAGAQIVPVETGEDGRLDIAKALQALGGRGITRLLVEGGPSVARSFLESGLVDCAVLFRGGELVGGGGLIPFVVRGLELIEEAENFRLMERRRVGGDLMQIFEKRPAEA